jgi:hypothetical protein
LYTSIPELLSEHIKEKFNDFTCREIENECKKIEKEISTPANNIKLNALNKEKVVYIK